MARPKKDLLGKKFGSLVVTGEVSNPGGPPKWDCRCDCGIMVTAYGGNLQSGGTNRCSRGCTGAQAETPVKSIGGQTLPPNPMDVIRKYDKFGIMTVQDNADKPAVTCYCGCGNPRPIVVRRGNLMLGKKLNCGECTKHKPPFKTLWGKPNAIPGTSVNILNSDINALGYHIFREEGTNKILWQHPDFPVPLDSIPTHYRLKMFDIVWIPSERVQGVVRDCSDPFIIGVAWLHGAVSRNYEVYDLFLVSHRGLKK